MPHWVKPEQYTAFQNEDEAMAFCKDWGLLPQKATKQKEYRYKGQNMDVACEIVGYADLVFAVIQIGDQLHNIHPSYLREMQTGQFGKGKPEDDGELLEPELEELALDGEAEIKPAKKTAEKKEKKPVEKAEKAEKAAKEAPITLPEGKLNFDATVSQFASVPNPFSDTDDEVIIFEPASFSFENEVVVLESAWTSHGTGMKKLELEIGDKLTFEAKIVAKKLNKHAVKYKLNNAGKIVKLDPA
ncbi:hypothetical protein EHS13_10750 [Paenibacillus psychroresistens]|uniref:Uncharacterized protein n=1 Tax=Paenibacillus psychroresistens TaxID=1778678 RepID=A0A6B8RHE7_9BACL|nr:hypothetical protein [Paenibacillus psychroresistens]QGQ95327.1 hypothetical protein EHS13_10750 [Paenibacillus psychroresistens]